MEKSFTRTRLRTVVADQHGIDLRPGQLRTWIAKGLLPDPAEEVWTEETILPRFLHIHAMKDTDWSLDRRVVQLVLDRYPVPASKVQQAMAGMVPTIGAPIRKLRRLQTIRDEFAARGSWQRNPKRTVELSEDWRPPGPREWPPLIRNADPAWFTQRLGTQHYFVVVLNDPTSGVVEKLVDIPLVEQLTLSMVLDTAHRRDHQQLVRDLETQRMHETSR
jgi:hypothetical protein